MNQVLKKFDMKKSPSIAAWVLQQVLVFTSTFAVIDKNANYISQKMSERQNKVGPMDNFDWPYL